MESDTTQEEEEEDYDTYNLIGHAARRQERVRKRTAKAEEKARRKKAKAVKKLAKEIKLKRLLIEEEKGFTLLSAT